MEFQKSKTVSLKAHPFYNEKCRLMRAVVLAALAGGFVVCSAGAASFVDTGAARSGLPAAAAASAAGLLTGEAHYSFTGTASTNAQGSGKATLAIRITARGTTGVGSIQVDVKTPYVTGCPGVTLDKSASGSSTGSVPLTFQQQSATAYTVGGGNFGIPVVEHVTEPVSGNSCETRALERRGSYFISLPAPFLRHGNLGKDRRISGSWTLSGPRACRGEGNVNWDTCTVTFTWSLERNCDPALLGKAFSEEQAARSLALNADLTVDQAHGEWEAWKDDEIAKEGKLASAKLGLLSALKLVSKSAVAVIEDIAFLPGIVYTVEWLGLEVYPHVSEYDDRIGDATKMYGAAADEMARATADFKAAVAGCKPEPKLHKQLDEALRDQELNAKARDLIESWDNNGRNLYWSPTRHEWEEERAALKEAQQILQGGRATQAANAVPVHNESKIRVTKSQLVDALALVNKALLLHQAAIRRQSSADALATSLSSRIEALLPPTKH